MKPKLSRQDVESLLYVKGVTDKVALVGVRGYYLDSMGKHGANDRGVYDDAIFIVSPTRFEAFQANTDPSVFRNGIASLKTGVHRYYKGKHKNRYWALRLVGETATVTRDGASGDKTGVALNIHKGGVRTTGSEGCQTLKPTDWDDFIEIVYDEMDDHNQKSIPYLLVDELQRRASTPAVELGGNLADDLPVNRQQKTNAAADPSGSISAHPALSPGDVILAAARENSGALAEHLETRAESVASKVEQSVAQNVGKIEETVSQTVEDGRERIEKTVSEVTSTFEPKNIPAFIPRLGKKWLLGLFPGAGVVTTISGYLSGLPMWLIFTLGVISGIALWNFFQLVIRHHEKVIDYIGKMNAILFDPTQDNPILLQSRGFVGRRADLTGAAVTNGTVKRLSQAWREVPNDERISVTGRRY